MGIKKVNNLKEIYAKGVVDNNDGTFSCSVCSKTYKQKGMASRYVIEHMNKQNCHTFKQIFAGTETEKVLYNLYIHMQGKHNKKTNKKITALTKTRFSNDRRGIYNAVSRFYLFCLNNHITNDMKNFLSFVADNTKWSYGFGLLQNAQQQSVLTDFYIHRRNHRCRRGSEKYYNQNEDLLEEDNSFVLRSLERGEMSVEFFFKQIDLDEFVDQLDKIEEERFITLMEEANGI